MKGTLSFASASFAERLVSFFLLPILTKLVTPAEYAIWSQSIIIAGVLMPVILLKFETSIIKFFPTWNNQNKKKKFSNIIYADININCILLSYYNRFSI